MPPTTHRLPASALATHAAFTVRKRKHFWQGTTHHLCSRTIVQRLFAFLCFNNGTSGTPKSNDKRSQLNNLTSSMPPGKVHSWLSRFGIGSSKAETTLRWPLFASGLLQRSRWSMTTDAVQRSLCCAPSPSFIWPDQLLCGKGSGSVLKTVIQQTAVVLLARPQGAKNSCAFVAHKG